MRRVCVLGNSHAAAIALGWKTVQNRYNDVSLTFFASPRDRLADLQLEGRALVPTTETLASQLAETSGGASRVDADVYDAFWLCGLSFGVRTSYALLKKYWAEFEQPDHRRTPISNLCLATTIASTLKNTLAYKLVTDLKQITDRPITLIPVAMWSEAVLAQEDDKAYEVVRRAVRDKKEDAIWEMIQQAYEMLEDKQLRIVPQPGVTLRSPLLSYDRYSRGSVRLTAGFDKEYPQSDFAHMNAEFGVEVVTALLSSN